MSVVKQVINSHHLIHSLPKQVCTCSYLTWGGRPTPSHNARLLSRSHDKKLLQWQVERYAGHSKWANIKHKKMHKDNARAKLFGRMSLEIIQAVKGEFIFCFLAFLSNNNKSGILLKGFFMEFDETGWFYITHGKTCWESCVALICLVFADLTKKYVKSFFRFMNFFSFCRVRC